MLWGLQKGIICFVSEAHDSSDAEARPDETDSLGAYEVSLGFKAI